MTTQQTLETFPEIMHLILTQNAQPIAADDDGFQGIEGDGFTIGLNHDTLVIDVRCDMAIIRLYRDGEYLTQWEVR